MDTLRLDAPATQKELELLQDLKVGEARYSSLFPALSVDIEWVCTTIGNDRWEFDGTFCGQPLCQVVITKTEAGLVLTVKES